MTTDNRFNDALENFEEHERLMNKLRRMRNLLLKAIDISCSPFVSERKKAHSVELPVGSSGEMKVLVWFNHADALKGDIALVTKSGRFVREGNVTLRELRDLLTNASPILDAAAQFCAAYGSLPLFRDEMARFNITEFFL